MVGGGTLGGASQVRRWPAFDGVRALAVMAVMSFHVAYPTFLKGGYTGVDVFFVLSGFLITSILVAEYDTCSDISYRKFYARRALRLLPALAVVIVTVLILVTTDGGLAVYRHLTLTGVPFVVLYVGNWAIAFGSVATLGLLSITWTLAIEEQYYLLWPLALTALLRRMDRRRIAQLLIGIAVVEMVLRLVLSEAGVSGQFIQKATVTHSDGLLLGSALGLLWSLGSAWKWRPLVEKRAALLGLLGLAGLAVVLFFGTPTLHKVFGWTALAVLASAALVLSLVAKTDGVVTRLFELAPLQWIGKRSYGCYLWHFPILAVVLSLNWSPHHLHFIRFVLVFGLTFLVAGLSYRIIELPFLARKARFSRGRAGISPAS